MVGPMAKWNNAPTHAGAIGTLEPARWHNAPTIVGLWYTGGLMYIIIKLTGPMEAPTSPTRLPGRQAMW